MKLPAFTQIRGLELDSPANLFMLALMSSVAGLFAIIVITVGVTEADDGLVSLELGLAFVVLLLLFRFTQSRLLRRSAQAIESALHEQRTRIAQKLLGLDFAEIDKSSRSELLGGIARHYESVSQAIMPLLSGFQNTILLVLILLFLFWQSLIVGLLTLAFIALIIQYYLNREGELKEQMMNSARADAALHDNASDLIDGFKELRLSRAKQDAILEEITTLSADVARYRTSGAHLISDLIILAGSTSFMLGATVVFILPIISGIMGEQLSRIVATELFLLGPLGAFVRAAEPLSIARFALTNINDFEQSLDARIRSAERPYPKRIAFRRLYLDSISYSHRRNLGEEGFAIQRITFDIVPGQITFITGSNGSGKTTLLRALTGLYPIRSGNILVNGAVVSEEDMDDYRHLFSTVFSDFHTFRKPYGLDEAGLAAFMENARDLGIADKLPPDISHGYDPGALSTGQRKRLALALALAESRPILVLDEWAADQDPNYRERFYRTILPRIKASGKAVLAVTHDERYFDLADKRYHMEDGQLKPVRTA